jgi:hypothetical protein
MTSSGSDTDTNPDDSSRDDTFAPSFASTGGDADVGLDLEKGTSGDSSNSSNSDNPPLLTGQGGTGGDPASGERWGDASGTPVQLPGVGWAWLTQAIFSLSIHCLTAPQVELKGNRFSSSLIAYTAIRGLQVGEDGQRAFYKPYNYTTILAGLIWVARLLLLEFAQPLHGYHLIPDIRPRASTWNHARRATQVHQAYGGRPSFSPMTELLCLMAGGMRIVRDQPQRPTIHDKLVFSPRSIDGDGAAC